MSTFSKTLIAAVAFSAIASSAFAAAWNFQPGTAYTYDGPGKMTAYTVATDAGTHEAMMKNAKKLPSRTVLFMVNGELYMTSGSMGANGTITSP